MATEENKDGVSKINELMTRFNDEAVQITARMGELSELMQSVHRLADNKHEIYNYRAFLVKRKLELMTSSNIANRSLLARKRRIYDGYKLGKSVTGSQTQIMPKNDFERQLYLNSDLKDPEFHLKLIDDQLQFIMDQIKGVDNFIYGIEYVLKLEEFKTSIK